MGFREIFGSPAEGAAEAPGPREPDRRAHGLQRRVSFRRLKIGDKVYAYSWANPKGGFYAEYVAVPSDKVAHVPAHLDLEHAGAIPTTGLTALQGIDDALALKRGDTIIIHGASGGVGTLAIQFAKLAALAARDRDRR